MKACVKRAGTTGEIVNRGRLTSTGHLTETRLILLHFLNFRHGNGRLNWGLYVQDAMRRIFRFSSTSYQYYDVGRPASREHPCYEQYEPVVSETIDHLPWQCKASCACQGHSGTTEQRCIV